MKLKGLLLFFLISIAAIGQQDSIVSQKDPFGFFNRDSINVTRFSADYSLGYSWLPKSLIQATSVLDQQRNFDFVVMNVSYLEGLVINDLLKPENKQVSLFFFSDEFISGIKKAFNGGVRVVGVREVPMRDDQVVMALRANLELPQSEEFMYPELAELKYADSEMFPDYYSVSRFPRGPNFKSPTVLLKKIGDLYRRNQTIRKFFKASDFVDVYLATQLQKDHDDDLDFFSEIMDEFKDWHTTTPQVCIWSFDNQRNFFGGEGFKYIIEDIGHSDEIYFLVSDYRTQPVKRKYHKNWVELWADDEPVYYFPKETLKSSNSYFDGFFFSGTLNSRNELNNVPYPKDTLNASEATLDWTLAPRYGLFTEQKSQLFDVLDKSPQLQTYGLQFSVTPDEVTKVVFGADYASLNGSINNVDYYYHTIRYGYGPSYNLTFSKWFRIEPGVQFGWTRRRFEIWEDGNSTPVFAGTGTFDHQLYRNWTIFTEANLNAQLNLGPITLGSRIGYQIDLYGSKWAVDLPISNFSSGYYYQFYLGYRQVF